VTSPALQLQEVELGDVPSCRTCGCTDLDCRGCIERTGEPCWWVPELEDEDGPICSACVEAHLEKTPVRRG
jgi:hypothetical protein